MLGVLTSICWSSELVEYALAKKPSAQHTTKAAQCYLQYQLWQKLPEEYKYSSALFYETGIDNPSINSGRFSETLPRLK